MEKKDDLRVKIQELEVKTADQAREIERLKRVAQTNWNEFAEGMKAQLSGVVLPERGVFVSELYTAGYNKCLDEVARLNSSPVSAGGVDERAAFEAAFPGYKAMIGDAKESRAAGKRVEQPSNMFRVWLYCRAALSASAPNHSEKVREVGRFSPAALIVQDVCDLDGSDEGPDVLRVRVDDLMRIAERHTAPSAGSQGVE